MNRAEAYVQKGMTGEALADLNEVRCNRITGYTNIENVPANLLEEVRLERRLELCFDEQRWFDLRRYGMPSITHRYRYRKSDPWVIYTLREKDPLYTLPLPNEAITLDWSKMLRLTNPRDRGLKNDKIKKMM